MSAELERTLAGLQALLRGLRIWPIVNLLMTMGLGSGFAAIAGTEAVHREAGRVARVDLTEGLVVVD